MNGAGPAGMSSSTLKICAPLMPTRFIASKSAVMPSLVMLPFIQCHQVWGLAESGGWMKLLARSSSCARACTQSAHTTNNRISLFAIIDPMVRIPTLSIHSFSDWITLASPLTRTVALRLSLEAIR